MTVYVSNLVVGLAKGLDDPQFLLDTALPFAGKVGIEFFLHDFDADYLQKTTMIPGWLGAIPRTTHGPFIGVEATSTPGTEEYQRLINAYEYGFDTAARLHSRQLVFHTHQRVIPPEQKGLLTDTCRGNIGKLIEMGKARGITVLIENLDIQRAGASLFDQEEFIALMGEFPEAGCLIDTGHLNVAHWDMERVISALGHRIHGYHLHNNDGDSDSHQRINGGSFPHDDFFRLYRQYTPTADLTLEYGDGHGITVEMIQEDIRYVLDSAKLFDK